MARYAKNNWVVSYSVTYTDGRNVTDTVAIGPCRFADIPAETGCALSHLMELPDVRGIDIHAIKSARVPRAGA